MTQIWKVSSEHVHREETQIELEGEVEDPETGAKGKAGLKVGWTMESAGAVASEFSVAHEKEVQSLGTLVQENWAWLAEKAESIGMGDGQNISQGFGLVTGVIYANSGLNIGSTESKSTFNISGSASGVKKMLGNVSGKGSYSSIDMNKSMDLHIWPDRDSIVAPVPVPIAYRFASFDKMLLIPDWIRELDSFQLFLNNKPGCTYITTIHLNYETPRGPHSEKVVLSGGLSKTIGDIPLDATNLDLRVNFKGMINDDNYKFHWDSPVSQWPSGQRHIDMSGVWPGKTHCSDREKR